MTRQRAVVIALAPVVLVGAFLFGTWLAELGIPREPAIEGDRAPDYSALSLTGDTVALEDFRPDAVLLNIWATWCLPCVREMPGLDSLHAEYGPQGLRVIGVSVVAPGSLAAVTDFIESHRINYSILYDPDQIITDVFFTWGVPETFLIDGRGRITRHWSGLIVTGSEGVRSEIEKILPKR